MKKIAFILVALLVVASCTTENKQEDVVREIAKKDAIEKLQLPEGTTFNNETIEVVETESGDASIGVRYLVKLTIKSQDREGNEIINTHIFNYEKIGDRGLNPEDYELISFE
ncbi:membrane lipoprotein lipid attachment site-containing protein [Aequorivita sp. Q41]|uniref:membrane lipoprotein lipid attachment site-containing protein n=1 Tax=Aequorivita sp. Q41 TaxID=3153300 RepID=UPI003242831E